MRICVSPKAHTRKCITMQLLLKTRMAFAAYTLYLLPFPYVASRRVGAFLAGRALSLATVTSRAFHDVFSPLSSFSALRTYTTCQQGKDYTLLVCNCLWLKCFTRILREHFADTIFRNRLLIYVRILVRSWNFPGDTRTCVYDKREMAKTFRIAL